MKHSVRTLVLGAAFVAGAFALASPADAATGKAFYDGKTVKWITATGTGGGHDFYARLFARHMEKTLPGSTIVVINRPGASVHRAEAANAT